jgi:hypothetical protein
LQICNKQQIYTIIEVATGLIDIYSKCGSLESAYKVFSGVPEKGKDIVLWSVIIASYGRNGKPVHAK